MSKLSGAWASIPDTGEKCSCPASRRWRGRGVAGRFPALGENRLLNEVEPVGEFDLLWNGSPTDPSPDFAEHRTFRGDERLEVESAVKRGEGVLQHGAGQFENGLASSLSAGSMTEPRWPPPR